MGQCGMPLASTCPGSQQAYLSCAKALDFKSSRCGLGSGCNIALHVTLSFRCLLSAEWPPQEGSQQQAAMFACWLPAVWWVFLSSDALGLELADMAAVTTTHSLVPACLP